MSKIEILGSLEDFFRDEINKAAKKQGVVFTHFTDEYVSKVLTKFAQSKSLVDQKLPNGDSSKEPVLALLWYEALEKKPSAQFAQMQYLGDVALFTSGFFADKIDSSQLDRDYYMAMGERAYSQAGTLQYVLKSDEQLRALFDSLAKSFSDIVSVLEEVSLRSTATQSNGLVKLYEKWNKSKDSKIQRILQENGVIPASNKGDEN